MLLQCMAHELITYMLHVCLHHEACFCPIAARIQQWHCGLARSHLEVALPVKKHSYPARKRLLDYCEPI